MGEQHDQPGRGRLLRRLGGWRPGPAARVRLGIAAGLSLLLFGALAGVHHYLNGEAIRSRLRTRVEAALLGRGVQLRIGPNHVDWLGRLTLDGLDVGEGQALPVVHIETVRVRPSYRALLAGQLKPATISLEGVELRPGPRGEDLRSLISAIRHHPVIHLAARHGAPSSQLPKLVLEDFSVWVPSGTGEPFPYGPWSGELTVDRDPGAIRLAAVAHGPGHGVVTVDVTDETATGGSVRAHFEGFRPDSVPEALRSALPITPIEGSVSADLQADFTAAARTGKVEISARAADLVLSGERLADHPVGPAQLAFKGTLLWDRVRRKLRLDDGLLSVGDNGELEVGLSSEASYLPPFGFRVDAHMDRLDLQRAIDSLPPQFQPGPSAPRLDGPLSAQLTLSGELADLAGSNLDVHLDLAGLKQSARQSNFLLKGPFHDQVTDESGKVHDLFVSDKSPSFVPLASLPPYVYRAVTASEDAGFFAHHGFDFQEMKNSFVSVAEDKRLRGGSTITQQLAKNLFLSRERTYARKVREALITLSLEAALSKQRLLEIYLNIIEWGPGIYGIGPAAHHYFGKDARALTPKEAAYLATIIPNPIRYHVYFERGELTDAWASRVHDLLAKMHVQGVLDDAAFAQADASPLLFRPIDRSADRGPEPSAQGRSVQ